MKKCVVIISLVILLLPLQCLAAPAPDEQNSISNYMFAKLMAETYAKTINEFAYDKDGVLTNDTSYFKVKLFYQIAQNKFIVLNNMYTLMLTEKGRILEKDEEKLAVIGRDAYNAFHAFAKEADNAMSGLSDNKYITEHLVKSVQDNITMREMLLFTFANVAHPDGMVVQNAQAEKLINLVSNALRGGVMTVPDAAALLASSYNQYSKLRSSKYGKLTTWIESCQWKSWDDIAAEVKASRAPKK